MMRSMVAVARCASPSTVPHLPNSMLVVTIMLLLSYVADMTWYSSLAPSTSMGMYPY